MDAHPRRQRGFTLIEIMVVITLIGLIATIVVPGVMNKLDEGKVVTTKSKITNLKGVLDDYRRHHGSYPDSLSVLQEPSEKNYDEPYLEIGSPLLQDAWGNDLIYTKSTSRKFELVSLGADGLEGGEGPDADLSSDAAKMVGQ